MNHAYLAPCALLALAPVAAAGIVGTPDVSRTLDVQADAGTGTPDVDDLTVPGMGPFTQGLSATDQEFGVGFAAANAAQFSDISSDDEEMELRYEGVANITNLDFSGDTDPSSIASTSMVVDFTTDDTRFFLATYTYTNDVDANGAFFIQLVGAVGGVVFEFELTTNESVEDVVGNSGLLEIAPDDYTLTISTTASHTGTGGGTAELLTDLAILVPAPGTWTLAGVASLALVRRRR